MAVQAHAAARNAGYCADEMIATYLDLFRRIMAAADIGMYRRKRGPIRPPPAYIEGTSIFAYRLWYFTRFGRFPSSADARRFREEAGSGPRSRFQGRS